MVSLTSADRIGESSLNPGSGDIPLNGVFDVTRVAVSARFANGDKAPFTVFGGNQWLTFEGTYNSGANTISRTRLIDGSSGLATNVSFSPGTYTVISGPLADHMAAGKQMIPIPAGGIKANNTNGPSANTLEMATNLEMIVVLEYDPTTAQFANVAIPMPNVWDLGSFTFSAVWSHPTTTTNFGVVWEVAAVAIGDGDAIDAAFGTGQKSTDTGGTANTLFISPESAAITPAGSAVAGDVLFLRIKRLPADASDTMAVVARLHAIRLFISTNRGHE